MSWIYKGHVFEDKHIPDGAIGFVYCMSVHYNGKQYFYIGKKNFSSNRRQNLAKKDLPKDKRKKSYKVISKLCYQDYFSSNDVLKRLHAKGVDIKREILNICFSKSELTYHECKQLFIRNVLEDDKYLNGNILGRFYKQKLNGKKR